MTQPCGRGAEIARNSVRPEHMCLHWGDVEFYAFARDGEDDTIDVRANVCIRWSKGETLDESKFRSIPFAGLLPVSMALEDTLRWLINLALLDGVFAQGIKTWDDLFNLKIPPGSRKTGIRIATNPAMRDIPVLRRMNAHRLTDKPVHTTEVQFEIHRLGLFCGFEHRLITYCFKRGVAYILALKTTDTTRRFLMGHKDDSAFRKYESKVSTVDFPALYRNMAPRSVLQQTSISLNRSDNAPVSISSSGKAAALEDDAVRAARSATEDLRKAIIVNHPSLIAASRAGHPLWTRYIRQQQRYRDTLVQVERRIFKAEYQLHFEERDLRQESGNCAAGKEQEEEQYDEEDADDRTSSLFIPEDDQMPTDSNDFLNDALELVSRFTWPTKHLAMPSEFRNREFRLLCSWFLTARTVT